MNLITNLGKNLKQQRISRKLSQEKFAEILDIHTNYYSSLERGKRNPTLKLVEKLAKNLGCEPLAFLR
jgi:transcriptional regulator with XRE-family HTH domain